jgi:hypothetical protein
MSHSSSANNGFSGTTGQNYNSRSTMPKSFGS